MSGKPNCKKCNKPKSECICGRPSKKTEDLVKKLESIFEIDGTIDEACTSVGISHVIYHKRMKEDKNFFNRIEQAKIRAQVRARHVIHKAINDGDSKLAMDFIRRRDNRYSDKQEIEHSGDMNIGLVVLPNKQIAEGK